MPHKKSLKGIKKRKNSIFFFKFCRYIRKQKIDLPSKKMTRWQAFLAIFFIVQAASGQNRTCLGVEITETVRNGNTKIRTGYAISQQWSAEAVSSFHICTPGKKKEDRNTSMELSFRHWCRECYKGSYMSFGIRSGFREETDMTFGLGYSISVWKGIGMDIGYGFKVLDVIRCKTLASGKITMEIHYIF